MGASSSKDYQYIVERRGAGDNRARNTTVRATHNDHYVERFYVPPAPMPYRVKTNTHEHRGRKEYLSPADSSDAYTRSRSYTRKRNDSNHFPATNIHETLPEGYRYVTHSSTHPVHGSADAQRKEKRRKTRTSAHGRKTVTKTSTYPSYHSYR